MTAHTKEGSSEQTVKTQLGVLLCLQTDRVSEGGKEKERERERDEQ